MKSWASVSPSVRGGRPFQMLSQPLPPSPPAATRLIGFKAPATSLRGMSVGPGWPVYTDWLREMGTAIPQVTLWMEERLQTNPQRCSGAHGFPRHSSLPWLQGAWTPCHISVPRSASSQEASQVQFLGWGLRSLQPNITWDYPKGPDPASPLAILTDPPSSSHRAQVPAHPFICVFSRFSRKFSVHSSCQPTRVLPL